MFRNPLDRLLNRARRKNKRRFLILWNRGLGDIPLGLYALRERIFQYIPSAEITFLTRKDLEEGFQMLGGVKILAHPSWKRREKRGIDALLNHFGKNRDDFDLILEKPDPTRWLSWQLGKLVPKLHCNYQGQIALEGSDFIGIHLQTETGVYYGYEKNWPMSHWQELLQRLHNKKIVLFGMKPDPEVSFPNVVDLRGKTNLFEMVSVVQNHCQTLIVPDSGVLSILYYVDADFPIKVISLWADPRQGVLRQNVPSPNSFLEHIPLIGKNDQIHNISVDRVMQEL